MSETTKPRHYEDAGFLRRAADSMADAIERLVLAGRLDSRSAAADAALNYRNPQFHRLDTIVELEDLIRHCWVHSNYKDGGYQRMTTEQKHLYQRVLGLTADGEVRCTCWLGQPGAMGGDSRERERCAVHGGIAV